MKNFDTETLLRFLSATFPNETITHVGAGWTSVAFQVGDYIVRIPRKDTEKYIKEVIVCDEIRDMVGVELPHITVVNDTEYPYSIHKKMIGNMWNSRYVTALDTDTKRLLANDCATFLASIHSINPDDLIKKAKSCGIDISCQKITQTDFSELAVYLKPYFSDDEMAALKKLYNESICQNSPDMVFCHNDFSGSNCIIGDNNRLIGVFDWGNCGIYERSREFMRLYFYEHEFFDMVCAKYEQITGVHIDKNRLRQLNIVDTMNLAYSLNTRPELKQVKETDLESWIIPTIRKFIEKA